MHASEALIGQLDLSDGQRRIFAVVLAFRHTFAANPSLYRPTKGQLGRHIVINLVKRVKGPGTCYSALHTISSASRSRKCRLIGMSIWYCGALCGHPLPELANNWTSGTVGLQHANVPPLQSATLGLQPVAHKLLLIYFPSRWGYEAELAWARIIRASFNEYSLSK